VIRAYARRWLPVFLVAALVLAAGVATTLSNDAINIVPLPQKSPVGGSQGTGSPSGSAGGSPSPTSSPSSLLEVKPAPAWLVRIVEFGVMFLLVSIVGLLLWALVRSLLARRRSEKRVVVGPGAPQVQRPAEQVLAAIEAGLADLGDTDRDPRAAVIACWLRMEGAAADAGTPRQPSDSPADLVDRLLRSHQVGRATLVDLAEVYRLARYGAHDIDEQMRARAVAALERVRAELRASRVGPVDTGEPAPVRYSTPAGGIR
jgi:hypothetical protein